MDQLIKRILIIVLFFIGISVYFVHHNIVFDGKIDFLNKVYSGINLNTNYIKFYIKKNEDPTYIFKSDIFEEYTKFCHENKKNCLIFPFQQFYADTLWLSTIQYLGSVIDVSKAPYMYDMLNNLSNLSPYWDYPYYFGELMLPLSIAMHSDLGMDKLKKSWINSINYGEKGKFFNCNPLKIKKILSLSDKDFFDIVYLKTGLWKDLKNPCDIYEIPYQLGFNWWFYLKNDIKSAINYKIASFFDDIPKITPSMVIIVNGRKGNYEKTMLLSFLKYISLMKKLSITTNQDDIKLLKSKAEEALVGAIVQYIYNVLKRADDMVVEDKKCYHDFKCLADKGFIKSIIIDDINNCKNSNINFSKLTIDDILTLDANTDKFNKIAKCFIIAKGLQKGYIKLHTYPYVFYKVDKQKYIFKYDYDYEYGSWWISPEE